MKVELFPFQVAAQKKLLRYVRKYFRDFEESEPKIISFTAPTGAGKTVIMAALIESIYRGDEICPPMSEKIFVWLSDSPELNRQSMEKILNHCDGIKTSQLIMIEDETFDEQFLDDGKIYFLNTQKLSKGSNLTKNSDERQYTIWQTLSNTIRAKTANLIFVIDEAHRGIGKSKLELSRATTIMQKFLKGSAEDGLDAAPLVIGISATIERFNRLVGNIGSSRDNVIISTDDVKSSGLLKEKIIVVYPDNESPVTKDMAMLEAAADEWKNKCEHWALYEVKPIFLIQVKNIGANRISETDLSECLKKISARTEINFNYGEVVHTFSQTASLKLNNLRVDYEEPSRIAGDDKVRVVFFKESLTTGWDCPRAETMMSFRTANDATYIAQLLGRMIRTPLQRRINDDETLNEVRLYLPHFDRDAVQKIIEELNNVEGGKKRSAKKFLTR